MLNCNLCYSNQRIEPQQIGLPDLFKRFIHEDLRCPSVKLCSFPIVSKQLPYGSPSAMRQQGAATMLELRR